MANVSLRKSDTSISLASTIGSDGSSILSIDARAGRLEVLLLLLGAVSREMCGREEREAVGVVAQCCVVTQCSAALCCSVRCAVVLPLSSLLLFLCCKTERQTSAAKHSTAGEISRGASQGEEHRGGDQPTRARPAVARTSGRLQQNTQCTARSLERDLSARSSERLKPSDPELAVAARKEATSCAGRTDRASHLWRGCSRPSAPPGAPRSLPLLA